MSGAADTLAKARKKSGGGGGWFGSASARMEEAHDLFTSAANQFKLEKQWKQSGDAFMEAAGASLKGGEEDDAANDYWAAAKSYKKSDPTLAVAALRKTIELYLKKGRFRQAADRSKDIGQIFQQDAGDLNGALDAYEQAGDWYAQEDATATANACYKDVADIAAQLDMYPKAIEKFELVAKNSLGSALTRYSVKEYYTKAALCHLASGDIVSTKRAIQRYGEEDPNFTQQREYKFLIEISDAVEAGDQETYTTHVAEYDQMSKLDAWKTSILLKIKKGIQEEDGLL